MTNIFAGAQQQVSQMRQQRMAPLQDPMGSFMQGYSVMSKMKQDMHKSMYTNELSTAQTPEEQLAVMKKYDPQAYTKFSMEQQKATKEQEAKDRLTKIKGAFDTMDLMIKGGSSPEELETFVNAIAKSDPDVDDFLRTKITPEGYEYKDPNVGSAQFFLDDDNQLYRVPKASGAEPELVTVGDKPFVGQSKRLSDEEYRERKEIAREAAVQTEAEKLEVKRKAASKNVREIRDNYMKQDRVKNSLESFKTLSKAVELGENARENPAAVGAFPTTVARLFEKGVLTNQDIDRYQGSPAAKDRIKRIVNKTLEGKMTKEDIDGLLSIVSSLRNTEKEFLRADVLSEIDSEKELGTDIDLLKKVLSPKFKTYGIDIEEIIGNTEEKPQKNTGTETKDLSKMSDEDLDKRIEELKSKVGK